MLIHSSHYNKYRKVFSLLVNERGLNIFEDRANEHEGSFRICEPLQDHSAVAAEFHIKNFLQKIRKEQQKQARVKTMALKDLIYEKEIYSLDLALEKEKTAGEGHFR